MQEQTVEQVIESIAHQFLQVDLDYGHGTDNAWDEAAWAVHFVLGLDYSGEPEQYQQVVAKDKLKIIQTLGHERVRTRKPMAYLTKQMWFAGIEFYVDERVLVPRSPISELILSRFHPWLDVSKVESALDLCTGSGCIGMALAIHVPGLAVTCTDISGDALQVASENRERLGLQDQIDLYQADLFKGIPARKYDLILSNPPYVDKQDMDALTIEFQHEPELGLASGVDGLVHVKRILKEACDYLADDGSIIIEVGNSMQALQEAYPHVPFMWLEFEHGGDGVFMLTARELKEFFS